MATLTNPPSWNYRSGRHGDVWVVRKSFCARKNTHDGLNVVVVVGGSNGLWPKLINTVFEDSQTLIYCCFGHRPLCTFKLLTNRHTGRWNPACYQLCKQQ